MKIHILTHPDLDLEQIGLKVADVRNNGGRAVVVNCGQDAPLDEHCADVFYYVHAEGQPFSNRGRRIRCVEHLEGKDLEAYILNSLKQEYGSDNEFILDDKPIVIEKVVEEISEDDDQALEEDILDEEDNDNDEKSDDSDSDDDDNPWVSYIESRS